MTGEILPDYLRAVRPAECLGHAKFIKKPEKVTLRTKLRLHFFRVDRPLSWARGLFFIKNTRKLLYGRNPACKFTIGMPPGGLPLVNLRSPGLFSSKTRGSLLVGQIPLVNLRVNVSHCATPLRRCAISGSPTPSTSDTGPQPADPPHAPAAHRRSSGAWFRSTDLWVMGPTR